MHIISAAVSFIHLILGSFATFLSSYSPALRVQHLQGAYPGPLFFEDTHIQFNPLELVFFSLPPWCNLTMKVHRKWVQENFFFQFFHPLQPCLEFPFYNLSFYFQRSLFHQITCRRSTIVAVVYIAFLELKWLEEGYLSKNLGCSEICFYQFLQFIRQLRINLLTSPPPRPLADQQSKMTIYAWDHSC